MNFAVIVPSKTLSNLEPCVRSVFENEPDLPTGRVVVIDDSDPGADGSTSIARFCREEGLSKLSGAKPFIFSRNVNAGIRRNDGCDGIVILGDDGLLKTAGGFSLLANEAAEHRDYGVIASTCNNVGNRNQWPRSIGLRQDPRIVCFVAVYIPRTTIEKVGLLDEDFGAHGEYGHEDDDYCYRVRIAGLKIGIHDGCFVDHGSLKSTFRGDPKAPADLTAGRRLFIKKHGSYPL